jgi:hypothetical protein
MVLKTTYRLNLIKTIVATYFLNQEVCWYTKLKDQINLQLCLSPQNIVHISVYRGDVACNLFTSDFISRRKFKGMYVCHCTNCFFTRNTSYKYGVLNLEMTHRGTYKIQEQELRAKVNSFLWFNHAAQKSL